MKHRKGRITFGLLVIVAAGFALFAAGCGSKNVNADSDNLACVYDGSNTGGHRFKYEVQPGQHIKTGSNDQVVKIPVSNRFYDMTSTDSHDTLAPTRLLAYAADNTPVWVQGELRFRFNTEGNKACEWYSKHGRRNDTGPNGLGFNVRGTNEQANAGWFHFLAENFGVTAQQVVHDKSSDWSWEQLVYGNDAGAKASASPALTSPSVSVAYGKFIGGEFTKYLTDNLGGQYFCGIQPAITGTGTDPNCPPIYFQVLSIEPKDASLTAEHEKLQRLQANLATQKQEAELQKQNRQSQIDAAKAQRQVLEEQIVNAKLQAQNDPAVQKCLIYARAGLDCNGNRPTYVIPGLSK